MDTNSHQESIVGDIIHEGFSTVSRTCAAMEDGQTKLLVVKSSSLLRKFAKEPHDIVKELRLLSSSQHPNIVPILGSYRDDVQKILNIYMPYLPISLSDLLASPSFSPHHFPAQDSPDPLYEEQFNVISKGIMIQVLSALAFLHHQSRQISHRDVKPQNIMFTKEGCVKLIDFGVSYQQDKSDVDKTHDLWPEYSKRLYFEVSTGPYRAPELLFGVRDYQPIALDLWSLGACLAEFFTQLRLCCDDMDDDQDDDLQDEKDNNSLSAFLVPKYLRIGHPDSYWKRENLFEGNRGEIGVAWSIFKIFGTPTNDSWPEYGKLPAAQSVVFNVVPKIPLAPLLPNIPLSSLVSQASSVLDILSKFLVYPPSARLSAVDALQHPWFTTSAVLCLPQDYKLDQPGLGDLVRYEYKGRMFGELLVSKLSLA